jgi:hypothetical protein
MRLEGPWNRPSGATAVSAVAFASGAKRASVGAERGVFTDSVADGAITSLPPEKGVKQGRLQHCESVTW